MIITKLDNRRWIRCGRCGHKLGRIVSAGESFPSPVIEIKCHSCKSVNLWGVIESPKINENAFQR